MRNYFTLLVSCFCLSATAQTAIDTSGGRYWNPLFSTVTVTSNISYGTAMTVFSTPQTLLLDVYEPTGDTVQYRPLLVFVHGGSFLGGTKMDQDVVELCNRFAKMGYVCASIEYRLGMGLPIDSTHAGRAVMRAVQDMKAAIRFFRMDYSQGNTYKIHPDYIYAGGSSAGAFTALHVAYLDSSEVPAYLNIANLGGLEGISGNPGYPSNVAGVINLCGALADSSDIQPGDVPFVSMHGDNDQTVPYGSSTIIVFGYPVLPVDGSASLHVRATNLGVNNPFYTWLGADHVPYAGTNATAVAYMDTTVDFVKAFLRPQLNIPTGIRDPRQESSVMIYPNPASDHLTIQCSGNGLENKDAVLYDATGRIALRFVVKEREQQINIAGFAKGIYTLRISGQKAAIVKKIVID